MHFRCAGMARQIFISYAREDIEFAQQLSKDLMDAGHKAWFDPSIKAGEDWEAAIETKLKESGAVIVILSGNSLRSKWVQHEGSMAYALNKSIYPLLIEPVESGELPLWSRKFQNHSFVDTSYSEALSDLIDVLIPPNPIQDLLDQQVKLFEDSEMLLSHSMLTIFNENSEQLEIGDKTRELIKKSETKLSFDKIGPPVFSMMLLLVGCYFLFQDHFQLRPIDLHYFFWPLVMFFGYFGFRRGWYEELLHSYSIILVLFITSVTNTYIFPDLTINNSLIGFLVLSVFLVYSIDPSFLQVKRSTSILFEKINRRTEVILSILIGLVNGYLLSGSIWFYLHRMVYKFPVFITGSSETLAIDYIARVEHFIQYMPPSFLGEGLGPLIYFAVAIVLGLVLLAYI